MTHATDLNVVEVLVFRVRVHVSMCTHNQMFVHV